MTILTYRITLAEPAILAGLEGDPNSAVSQSYIPGSVIRGALVARWQRMQGASPLTDDDNARRLFLDGTTRYLNAYLVDRLDRRSLPVPSSWHYEKGNDNDIVDFGVDQPDDPLKEWKPERDGYCTVSSDKFIRVQPAYEVAVHVDREPVAGRPTASEGALFRYVALARNQTFAGAIICDDDQLADELHPLLADNLRIGRSRQTGYGHAQVSAIVQPTSWREAESANPGAGELVVTLLSDMLIRNRHGEWIADSGVVASALGSRLGATLTPVHERTFLRSIRVGAFNRTWGLPAPQSLAIRMGSVIVLKADAPLDDKALSSVQAQGIGERRAGGFGRIAINWQTEPSLKADTAPPETPESISIAAGSDAHRVAQAMLGRMLRSRLDGYVTAQARDIGRGIHGVNKSQLSRLRLVVQDATRQNSNKGRERLLAYCKGLEDRQTTRTQFQRAHADDHTLLEWLRMRIRDGADGQGATIWTALKVGDGKPRLRIGDAEPTLTPQLAYEYNLRLVDATLEYTIKSAPKGGSK